MEGLASQAQEGRRGQGRSGFCPHPALTGAPYSSPLQQHTDHQVVSSQSSTVTAGRSEIGQSSGPPPQVGLSSVAVLTAGVAGNPIHTAATAPTGVSWALEGGKRRSERYRQCSRSRAAPRACWGTPVPSGHLAARVSVTSPNIRVREVSSCGVDNAD